VDEGIGFGETMLKFPGFRILDVDHDPDEMVLTVETTANVTGCTSCGTRARAHERRRVSIRDLPCFGSATRLVWVKRRWRCPDSDCETKTRTESADGIEPRVVLSKNV
jgi:transposase